VKKLTMAGGKVYAGNAASKFRTRQSLHVCTSALGSGQPTTTANASLAASRQMRRSAPPVGHCAEINTETRANERSALANDNWRGTRFLDNAQLSKASFLFLKCECFRDGHSKTPGHPPVQHFLA